MVGNAVFSLTMCYNNPVLFNLCCECAGASFQFSVSTVSRVFLYIANEGLPIVVINVPKKHLTFALHDPYSAQLPPTFSAKLFHLDIWTNQYFFFRA